MKKNLIKIKRKKNFESYIIETANIKTEKYIETANIQSARGYWCRLNKLQFKMGVNVYELL